MFNGLSLLARTPRGEKPLRQDFFPAVDYVAKGTLHKIVNNLIDRGIIRKGGARVGGRGAPEYEILMGPTEILALRDDPEQLTYLIWPHLATPGGLVEESAPQEESVSEGPPQATEPESQLPVSAAPESSESQPASPQDLTLRYLGAVLESNQKIAEQLAGVQSCVDRLWTELTGKQP